MKLGSKPTPVTTSFVILWIISVGLYSYYYNYAWRHDRSTQSLPVQTEKAKGFRYNCTGNGSRSMIPCRCEVNHQAERKRRLRSWCAQHHRSTAEPVRLTQLTEKTYVDEDRRLIYCDVPKVATTNWKRVFLYLSGKWNVTRPEEIAAKDVHSSSILEESLPRLSKYSAEEIRDRLDTYTKFFFVRHPMERLVSAFRNKFHNQNNSYFPQRFGKQIIKLYRQNATKHSLESGDDVEFSEFVDYLVDPVVRGYDKNAHWAPITSLCHPCDIQYDFVGQLETLSADADAILSHAGVTNFVHFPARADTYGIYAPSAELLASTFRDVEHVKLRRLLAIYRGDMEAFGYNCSCPKLQQSISSSECDNVTPPRAQ